VDGRPVANLPCAATAIIGGDARSLLIAAASVVAKVLRDRYMTELDARFPGYRFSANKGYGTHDHVTALMQRGPCPEHRRSFRPVQDAEACIVSSLPSRERSGMVSDGRRTP
jgi:ribonuclease HII